MAVERLDQEAITADVLLPPRHIGFDGEVWNKLESYLAVARKRLRQEHNRKVLETAYEEMVKAGEFASLSTYGDSLDDPPQW